MLPARLVALVAAACSGETSPWCGVPARLCVEGPMKCADPAERFGHDGTGSTGCSPMSPPPP